MTTDDQVAETTVGIPEDLPTGPAPLLQGDAMPLPGFDDVAVVDDGKGKPWQD